MIITTYADRDSWMLARRGKITGSRLKDIISKKGEKKKGFYELIAERLAIAPDGERPMDRGTRLEDIAIERYMQETGKKVDTTLVIWAREDNPNIAVSPDGVILETEEPNTEGTEVKCLNSASHIEAYITQDIPSEYRYQVLQYYCSNDELKALDVIFYDPRMTVKDYFVIHTTRDQMAGEIQYCLEYQMKELAEVEAIIKALTF